MDDEERLEGEEEMELDEASDGEDDDEEAIGIPVSPANSDQLFTGVPVTPGNVTPEETYDPLRYQKFPLPGGKPLSIRRGPGRPRKERPPGTSMRGIGGTRRPFGRGSTRGKGLYSRGGIRRTKSKDDDTHSESQSPLRLGDEQNGDGETSGIDRSMPAPEEPPYVPEKWPGKVCAFCNLGERSQLGQGELLQINCPIGFTPEKNANREESSDILMDVSSTGDKSPRGVGPGAVTCRRQKSLAKCRNPSLTNFTEPVEELTIVGYSEEPDITLLFETTGQYYVHKSCAIWSSSSKDIITESISPAIVLASSRRCAYCSHYGAGIPCKVGSCNRYFHLPCAAASSCFQDTKTVSLFCSQHLGQVPLLLNGDITCMQCYGMGDVSNLVMCSICGQHYHGSCVGLALLPGVRAGWQCAGCRICQVCRQQEEVSKVMLCEQCDKAYHPGCLRPIVTSIPKYGWKCKCCRVCTDCGSRTPGAGLSSRWHSHYTVCDSCYQQRNKGFSCPLCRKAYRAAAYREMVQCSSCKKFVHGTCDPEADPLTYQHRKETKPDYEYVCQYCKTLAIGKRKDNIDDYGGDSSLTASQESLYGDGDSSEFDYPADDPLFSIGLGKGKPFCASKIAKKRLGLTGIVGRPKGVGKLGYHKRQKLTEFGRKRGPKAKMRGIFGVPGVGLQKPQSDSSKEEEPGVENRLVLCSAKDKFVLTQDICVMCGAIGTDSEGCLIACAQCGQCYHPYCANVKVTKVILQKGWRCLDCTVCEGCGERHDEGRLILCDDCDISYHIYCMDPPLDFVPHGTWKCKWCALCQTCGSNDPGFNSSWQKNYTQCGPCASHSACASCQEPYTEGDLIIQCVQCERWLHCACDHIKTEADAEKCAEEGYNCCLCRPRDVPPPHIQCNLPKPQLTKYPRTSSPPPLVRSPELYKPSAQQYLVDGVYLSEAGMHHIKSLTFEQQQTRKKRRKMLPVIDKDADIMATIESVVAGSSLDNSFEENGGKLDMDIKDEPNEVFKEGMVWTHTDQPPPDGYSLYTTENGISVLRRKRQRNLQKLGIGGFVVRLRGTRKDKEHEGEPDKPMEGSSMTLGEDKPRKKVQRKKQQPKLAESFPLYMQEAFFGKDLMDITKDRDLKSSSDSDSERNVSGNADTIQLSQDELKAIEQVKSKNAKEDDEESKIPNDTLIKREEIIDDDASDTEALGDILPISSDLLDSELVNTIMNEPDDDLAKASEALDELDDGPGGTSRDELTDILSPHFNLESMVRDTSLPNMDSKDVEELFKGVLTDESQESQESSVFPIQAQTPRTPSTTTPLVSPSPHPNLPTGIPLGRPQVPGSLPPVAQSNLNSPMSFPPPSPYHSEYSNSPQFSPAFSEPPSPWVNPDEEGSVGAVGGVATGKQGNNVKMFQDEKLGAEATISSVLYANLNHPEWKEEFPSWPERCKQILKKWRALPNETKAPYLTQARDNRATVRMKKTQQEQDRLSNRDRSTREAEQERQWKQLQALRQQQAALQQQVIHEQRIHAMARAHRQINDDGSPMTPDNNSGLATQLQVTTSQDGTQLGPMASPSPSSRATFATPPLKVNRVATPQSPLQGIPRIPNQSCPVTRPVGTVVRPGLPNTFAQPPSPFSPQAPQSPHDFPQSPAASQSQDHQFQRFDNPEGFNQGNQTPRPIIPGTPTYATSPRNDVFSQPPGTPRPIFNPPTPRTSTHVYAPSRTPDPYSNQPQTPSPAPSYTSPRPESRQEVQQPEVFSQQPEVNRQLRDLLQRQQFSKKIEQIPGNWSQDGPSPSGESVQQQFDQGGHVQLAQHVQPAPNTVEGTFRHPLPPGIRPRMPLQLNVFIRNSQGNVDARIQSMDPRTRMLLQRPQVPGIPQQHFQNQPQPTPQQVLQQRMPVPRNQMADQYEMLQQSSQVPQSQQQQLQTPPQSPRFTDPQQHNQAMAQRIVRSSQDMNTSVRMMTTVQPMQRPNLIPSTVNDNPSTSEASEIPDNVTAELEKLEQEGAPMVEVEGVSAILGDLAEDDDELLAEMGADFNILEYADPELDNITGGEKTNILDMDLEQVEVETKEEKLKKESKVEEHKTDDMGGASTSHEMSDTSATGGQQVEAPSVPQPPPPPPVQVQQIPTANQQQTPQQTPSAPMLPQNHPQAVVVQQQMNHHVQQAAAMGRPMPPGTRLLSPDGAVGVVTSTNTVTVSYPSTFPGHGQRVPQQHIQLQQQRLGMRVPGVQGVPGRVVSVSHMIGPRMPLAPPPPPPPPPYPGPPPPYPGPVQEQPLLLEDLLEQEKREQEKQQKQQQVDAPTSGGPLLSDSDFERLRADVLGSSALGSPPQGIVSGPTAGPVIRPPGKPRPPSAPGTPWPQVVPDAVKLPVQTPRQPIATQTPPESRIATFNIPHLPAPPAPPDVIVTEQDRMIHMQYEQWLQHQAHLLKQQQTYYDTEVQKLRKARKSLNSKQRQLRKSGNELTENDAIELQRISNEQAVLQKQLDASRKQVRQHNMLAQEYQSKQQQRQAQPQTSEPCSPLMSPSQHSSPMHSPAGLVSHSPGPGSSSMIQHSPATSMIQHSPNPPLLQHSPGTQQPTNPGTMSPHSMQQSPRIGTPHSQPEESPFSPGAMPSPGMCGPTVTRMASPQHRAVMSSRLATSPGAFPQDARGNQQILTDQGVRIQNIHQRFVRPPNVGELVQRPRMQMQGGIIYNQRSPLGSPQPSQQPMLTQQQHQQLLQRQIQQQQQQQQQQHDINAINQEQNMINQRNLQLAQQRQMMSQSQQSQQHVMQKPPNSPMVSQPASSPSPQLHQQMQQNYGQPPSSPMPRSPMVQQTMGSPMLQQQLSQNSQPPSPMGTRIHHPPTSPMVSQYQPNPPSPMARNHPSTSPMLQHQLNNQHHPPPPQTPSSPMPRSPMVAGSPMQMQRRQSSGNSPAMPDRPQSVENPGTPRTPHTPHYTQHSIDQQQINQNQMQENQNQIQQNQSDLQNRGGGNPHNPLNPIPFKRNFGRFGFIKLGLRGGSPMWSTKPESSKGKTEPRLSTSTVSDDKPNTSAVHRKTGISQSKINSLVCADYNDFDDDSHTPPQTPPTRVVESKILQGPVAAEKASSLSLGSPSDKLEAMPDTTDYDDDKTIVNEEVTLSSTAQRDNDDITVIEEFAESELADVVLGALDPDMQEEYVLFEQDMVVDLSVDSNDSLSHALVNNTNQSHDLVQILEIEQSHDDQVLSDEELLPTQTRNKKGLRLDIVRTLGTGKRLVTVTDTPESPDQEEIVDQSPVTSPFLDHSSDHNFMTLVGESEVVILDPSTKSPEDNFTKESCGDEESEKIDCNSVDTSQKIIHEKSKSIKSSTPESIDKKTSSFNFSDKSTLSPGNSAILTTDNESIDASQVASTISINEAVTKPITTTTSESFSEIVVKDVLTASLIENEKQTILPVSMASIVADAKIAEKLSQTSMQTTLTQVQVNSLDVTDGPDGTSKTDGAISENKTDMTSSKNLFIPKNEETIINSVAVKSTSVTLKPKMSVSEMSNKDNEISKSKTSSIVEPEKPSTIGKTGKEDVDDEKTKTDTNISNPMTNCNSSTSDLTEEMVEEKKTDPLNTTDELESMLEAIHNPAENALNGDSKKEKSELSSRQRISPVADEISLVNILESDTEPSLNDKKDETKEQSEKSKESESIDFSETSEIKAETPTSRQFEESVNETEENESPDDILDMLHNIISTKPEMANTDILEEDRSRKSSLIYQLPTPLESLPLNILQDSLMDLEVPGTENEQPPQIEEKLPNPTPVTTESQVVKKSPVQSQPSTTIAVSTVAQLQRSTTTVPHLSPLSKPTELTSNVANVSHQLRTLLSSLHTNHSQSYTTAGQTTLVTMVSSVSSGSKASIVVTAPGTNSLSSTTTTINFTKSSVDTKSTFSVQLKESQSVISTLNKTTASEQFNRISSSVGGSLASLPTTMSRPATNSGISITSNAMLNAMLSRTPSAKSSIAGHRANTILTSNLLSSVLPSPIVQKSQNLQAILQVSSSASLPTKASLNVSSAATTSVQSAKTVVPPMASSAPNTINVTTSILQSTLSQAPTLHSQLTSGQPQYKTTGLLPIDNKSGDLEALAATTKEEDTKPQTPTRSEADTPKGINAHRMEESQNVLLKQLLQNTACATTVPPSSTSTAPSLPIVPSLEAQLARPTPTPPSSLLPPLLNKLPNTKSAAPKQILNRETSFVSQPPALKTQSPPIKEEILPKASTPVSSGSVPPLHCTPRQAESVSKPQIQSKVGAPMVSQSIASAAVSKPIPVVSKIESPPQSEAPSPISATPGPIKTPTSEPMTSNLQMRVTSIPTTFARLITTTKPVATAATQKIIPTSQQLVNSIPTSSQPSTPIATTPPNTPQPQLQVQVQTVQKPSTPVHITHHLNQQQQLQSPRIHVVNTIQPSVPHTMTQKLGHQAHLQQGAIAQHTVPLVEVKKEILDEVLSGSGTTQNSDTKDFLTAKEEIMDGTIDDKTDLKKLKRRQYQQKRRQSQGKDASAPPQKKRSRKVSRLDEDYDTFVDNLMIQLRQLPQMTVLEPLLGRNYGVCPIFGSSDLSKIGNQKDYNTRTGDLTGVYGVARLMGVSDHYNTHPFGEQEPSPPQQPASTQRGFYDQEFPPLKLDDSLDKKENLIMTRDVDTPDTIVSSSSPECVIPEFINRFPGLRLIEEESDEESDWLKRVSPVIPLVSPIPIRLKPAHIKDNAKQDKENVGTIRLGKSPPVALRENGNVTVTLTLNSQAADDIMGVLKDLANILNISPPNGYQIVERTTTPPSQKLGLYRTKGKDGKEGAPIDIQSILNGAAKFCRHCDVVILNSLIRKKVSDLPFLSKEEAEPGDELCFCSATCYMQFALMHRAPTTNQGKAATIVDHLCQKSEVKLIDNSLKKKQQEKRLLEKPNLVLEGMEIEPIEINRDIKIKTEKDDTERLEIHEEILQIEEKRPKKHAASEDLSIDSIEPQPPAKLWRGVKYKFWTIGGIQPATKYKKPTDKEITEMLFRMGVTVSPAKTEDSRRCMFCQNQGDGAADGPARLLNFDVDKWVHLNCALWSEDVYETVNGALMNLDIALQHSLVLNCVVCEKPGATVKCFKIRCTNVYHLGCAVKDGCVFYKNKSTFCSQHVQKNDKDNELTTLSVYRRVYVNRDENRQVAAVMHHSDHNHLLRVGSLIFLSVGQLLPHQLANFHTPHYIYPVGYKIVRFYWSMRRPNKRCRYVCSIHDVSGRPEFRVLVQEPAQEDVELRDATPRAVWSRILQPLSELRKSTNSVQLFPRYVSGEDLFGLTEPAIVRVLESLPGIETLTDYRPKYGRNPLLELPLAINPTGSARTEARLRNQLPWKRPHTQRTGSSARATYAPAAAVAGEVACPYSKQFVHSKSSQYKKMKQDWRNNVYLARSKIQGLGLYAARDLEKHQMVIEYIGEIIRTELAETREKQYEARNRGIYMFRLDEERVVDATLCGGLARYINHSCNPNCVAEIVEVERDLRIIIFAKRRISRGEELAYDYKFDIEDDQHKIACACGAPNCRKWMN